MCLTFLSSSFILRDQLFWLAPALRNQTLRWICLTRLGFETFQIRVGVWRYQSAPPSTWPLSKFIFTEIKIGLRTNNPKPLHIQSQTTTYRLGRRRREAQTICIKELEAFLSKFITEVVNRLCSIGVMLFELADRHSLLRRR